MSLHIGDKILEVNGTPVKDQPIENIENLMRNSNNVLQVMSIIRMISILPNLNVFLQQSYFF